MAEAQRPSLPIKLPPEFRKKLSIIFPDYSLSDSSSKTSSIEKNTTEEYCSNDNYYKEPIEQPLLRKSNEKSESKNLSFFNDSIYLNFDNKENSSSDLSDIKSDNSYLSLDKLESDEKNLDKSLNTSQSDTSNLNESISVIELNDSEQRPPIPPKRTKKILSLSTLSLNTQSVRCDNKQKRISSIIDECFSYLSPNDKKAFSLELFRKEIFKSNTNKTCADCKRPDIAPNWISCAYFVTLCDFCAECHLKLSHLVSIFYVIKIDFLYEYLQSNDSKLDPITFIKILNQTGNEKLNSLLEYNSDKQGEFLSNKQNIEIFIKEKYLYKKFINTNELDMSTNFIDELNRTLYQIVSGPSVSMTIYYLFLGANRNYYQNEKTLIDVSLDSNQNLQYQYLNITKSLCYSQLKNEANFEYLGDACQIYNFTSTDKTGIKKVSVNLKLKSTDFILTQFDSNRIKSQKIALNSVIKVFTLTDTSIELKWCNSDHCILSHYLEFATQSETQLWLKHILLKIYPQINSKFNELYQCLQINSFGFLTLINQYNFENKENKNLIILFECMRSQVEKYFKKFILFINLDSEETFFELIDVRKLNKIKLEYDCLTIDSLGKIIKLKSDGYGQNLKLWHDKLTSFVQLEFRSFEEQILNKENCVLLVEKCCSFIELHYLTTACFYPSNPKYTKKYQSLLHKLERDKDYKLDAKEANPNVILTILKSFFSKFTPKNSIKNVHIDTLKTLRDTVFYSTLKRVILHLHLIQNYKSLNQMKSDYLSNLFIHIIFGDECNVKIENMIENFQEYFELKPGYLKLQYEIYDKLIKIKSIEPKNFATNQNFLITIYLFHKHSEQSFQIQIDSEFSCKDALTRAKDEFKFYESKYWCLFEIFDHEQHLALQGLPQEKTCVLLERILPTKAKLIESISNWNSFNFVVKYNFIQIDVERLYITNESSLNCLSFLDKCQVLVLCETCGCFRTSFSSKINSNSCTNLHKKWHNSIVSVRNANVRLYDLNSQSVEDFDQETAKVFYEEKIEDSLFYYGLYESNSLRLSRVQKLFCDNSQEDMSNSKMSATKLNRSFECEVMINEEECLTFYDKKQKLVYLVHLESKDLALTRYCNLFKLAYYPDTWSIFKSDQMPNLKPKVAELRKSVLDRERNNRIS